MFEELTSGTLPQRAAAADKIAVSLNEFAISSIPEIWYMVRDLCHPNVQLRIRRCGLRLMIRCIHADDADFVSNNLVFLNDLLKCCLITDSKLDPEYDLFLQALKALTREGKEVNDFCIYDESRSFLKFFESALGHFNRISEFEDVSTLERLIETLYFLQDCFRYNGNILDSHTVNSLVSHIISVILHPTADAVVLAAMSVFKALVESDAVINENFYNLVVVMCSCYNIDSEIDYTIWSTVHIIYATPMSIHLLYHLLTIIDNPELRHFKNYSAASADIYSTKSSDSRSTGRSMKRNTPLVVCLGAVLLLELIALTSCIEDNDRIDSFHADFFKNLKLALLHQVPVLNTAILRMFDRVFSKAPIEPFVKDTSHAIVGKAFPFYFWHSQSRSLFELLSVIRANNDVDKSYWKSMCMSLQQLHEDHEINCPKERLVDFFMEKHDLILESNVSFVLKYYSDNSLCLLANPFHKDNISNVLNNFYFNDAYTQGRIEALKVVLEAFERSCLIFGVQSIENEIFFLLFRKSLEETNDEVREYLLGDFLTRFALGCPPRTFFELCSIFAPLFPLKKRTEKFSLVSSSSFASSSYFSNEKFIHAQLIMELARSMCKVLVITSSREGEKASQAYDLLLNILQFGYEEENYQLLVLVSRCLIRIRCTVEGFIYFAQPTDMGGLASAFQRNMEDRKVEENQKPVLWAHPEEVKYLPLEYFDRPTSKLVLFNPEATKLLHLDKSFTIDITRWFSAVLDILENHVHWEIYSFLWAHVCTQISNMHLFKNREQILRLRTITCEQLQLRLPKSLNLPAEVSKGDLQVAFIRSLLGLLAYHDVFSKHDEDGIVSALVHGLHSWEKTAIPCIHILTICCYEIPLSIKKFLSAILTQLQFRVTNTLASTHTLEFLMSLVHIPSLTSNFTIDEYMRVFGIAFKYIQLATDIKSRLTNDEDSRIQRHGVEAQVEHTPSTLAVGLTPILAQYLYTISYSVISNWYLKMSLRERPGISSYLITSLKNCSEKGDNEVDDQTAAFIDFVHYFADSNVSLKIMNAALMSLPQSDIGNYETKSWVIGGRVISVLLDLSSGLSRMIVRSGSGFRSMKLLIENIDQEDRLEKVFITASHILSQFSYMGDPQISPVVLNDDYMTLRAVTTIDRIPTVEFHKIGVLYIAPQQESEIEVLGNQAGSRAYLDFLSNIGEFIRLKGCDRHIYVGGLDTENGTDGEYGLFWSDKITQLVFHVTTLMKNNDGDKYYDLKKSHIGNNYVNIFFDESGHEFDFNLIKTQFNFLNIVISPHTKSSSMFASHIAEIKRDNKTTTQNIYKVKTYRRSGVPGLFATCHFKLVSEQQLPLYVRNLAIIADQFASIWHSRTPQECVGNWARRVDQINRLREKAAETQLLNPLDKPRVVTGSAADSLLLQLELR